MVVLGIRCLKDCIKAVVLEGTKSKSIVIDKGRLNILLVPPVNSKNRAEILNYLRRDFLQLIGKYKPNKVCIKSQETSPFKINIISVAQRGEIEGIIQQLCFENSISVLTLPYSSIKSLLKFKSKAKSNMMEQVNSNFDIEIKDEYIKDAILCAWAVLD